MWRHFMNCACTNFLLGGAPTPAAFCSKFHPVASSYRKMLARTSALRRAASTATGAVRNASTIQSIHAREIINSRGNPTGEADLTRELHWNRPHVANGRE
ncbi:hypothetical protein GN244_ATG01337 [Phytophthora infestans]|nr:hypothetical protein GN244_ATG01337 [Phytophthora infestans]KAF4144613.1 hypothetical protein GN958_ATG06193 [Phytophthora infestans]